MTAINRFIDQAVLQPELTASDAADAISLGVFHKVRTVCVRPCDIRVAKQLCLGSETEVCTVLGFPHGVGLTEIKVSEAGAYANLGVTEIDMVANYGWLRSSNLAAFSLDIGNVLNEIRDSGIRLKVILETGVLSSSEISTGCKICADLGVDFVKTSTGFNGGGATVEAVRLMLAEATGGMQVKASGGVRDMTKARMYLDMGVTRLGVNFTFVPQVCNESSAPVEEVAGY